MNPFESAYIPMREHDPFSDPLTIGLQVFAIVISAITFWLATIYMKRKNAERKGSFPRWFPFAVSGTTLALAVVVSVIAWTQITSSDPNYGDPEEKIVSNIKVKYEVASVHIDVPNTENYYVIDPTSGDYMSKAWVTTTGTGGVVTDVYDVVVDDETGEPVLKREFADDTTTPDPSEYLKK